MHLADTIIIAPRAEGEQSQDHAKHVALKDYLVPRVNTACDMKYEIRNLSVIS